MSHGGLHDVDAHFGQGVDGEGVPEPVGGRGAELGGVHRTLGGDVERDFLEELREHDVESASGHGAVCVPAAAEVDEKRRFGIGPRDARNAAGPERVVDDRALLVVEWEAPYLGALADDLDGGADLEAHAPLDDPARARVEHF